MTATRLLTLVVLLSLLLSCAPAALAAAMPPDPAALSLDLPQAGTEPASLVTSLPEPAPGLAIAAAWAPAELELSPVARSLSESFPVKTGTHPLPVAGAAHASRIADVSLAIRPPIQSPAGLPLMARPGTLAAQPLGTITVNTTTDEWVNNAVRSLREAIMAADLGASFYGCVASGSAPYTINLPAGTYTLTRAGVDEDQDATGDLDLDVSVTIAGSGRDTTSINGNQLDRVFDIWQPTGQATPSVEIDGLTITNGKLPATAAGRFGGAVSIMGAHVTLDGVKISNSQAVPSGPADTATGGGGVYVGAGGTFLAHYGAAVISGNQAASGGGIMILNGTATLNDGTQVIGNTALAQGLGGGIYNQGTLSVNTGCQVNGNTAPSGGGLFNFGGTASFYDTSVVQNNAATDTNGLGGAGVVNLAQQTAAGSMTAALTVDFSSIDHNNPANAAVSGGGIVNQAYAGAAGATATAQVHIRNQSTLANNKADFGGCLYQEQLAGNGGTAQATTDTSGESSIDHCTASASGGGIYNAGGTVTAGGGSIASNSAASGGGLFNYNGNVTVSDVDVTGNAASNTSYGGAGLLNYAYTTDAQNAAANLTLQQARVYLNNPVNAAVPGGGITNFGASTGSGSATATLSLQPVSGQPVQIYGNKAAFGAGVYNNSSATGSGSASATAAFNGTVVGGATAAAANSASQTGGGIYNSVGSTATLVGANLAKNSAGSGGGGLANFGTVTLVAGSTVISNTAGAYGGGMYNAGSLTASSNSAFTGNSALAGGGLYNTASAELTGVTVSGNTATGTTYVGGAGLANVADPASATSVHATMNLLYVTVQNNNTGGLAVPGGGITNFARATPAGASATADLSVGTSCQVTGNKASGGGGIYNAQVAGSGTAAATTGAVHALVQANTALAGTPNTGGGIYNAGSFTLSSGTVKGNHAANGGGLLNLGSATLDQATFNTNTADKLGGGVYNAGTANLRNLTQLTSNIAGSGGGMFNGNGVAALSLVTVSSNQATGSGSTDGGGGGIYNLRSSGGTTAPDLVLVHTTMTGNTATGSGGGILNRGNVTVQDSSQLINNNALAGGGLYSAGGKSLIYNSWVKSNNTTLAGGAGGSGLANIADAVTASPIVTATMTISNSTISNNNPLGNSTRGGGVTNFAQIDAGGSQALATLVVNNSSVSSNKSGDTNANGYGGGGGLFNGSSGGNASASATLESSTIELNSSSSAGGGLTNVNATATLNNSTVRQNTATTDGGGIQDFTTLILNDSTISGNTANGSGGGINQPLNTAYLYNATVTANVADQDNNGTGDGGGLAVSASAHARPANSIMAGNFKGSAAVANDCSGSAGIQSQGYNVVGSATGCPSSAAGDQATATPLLGPLQPNNGPTLTHQLDPGSPAIDHGNPAGCLDSAGHVFTRDQRGELRPVAYYATTALCDAGAFELQATEVYATRLSVGASTTAGATQARDVDTTNLSLGAWITAGATQLQLQLIAGDPVTVTTRLTNQRPAGLPGGGVLPLSWQTSGGSAAAPATGFNLNMRFCFTASQLAAGNGAVESNLHVFYLGAGGVWLDRGGTLDPAAHCLTLNNVTQFGKWSLIDPSFNKHTYLPIIRK